MYIDNRFNGFPIDAICLSFYPFISTLILIFSQTMTTKFISPKETKERLNNNPQSLLVIDVRDESEYADWHIKESINLPINHLIVSGNAEAIKEQLGTLSRNKDIVTVCKSGINSQVASSILADMNYNAFALKKGMKGWNENFDIYELDFDEFAVVQFVRIGKGCLSYIVYSKSGKPAVAIDASIFTDEYIDYAKAHSLNIKYVLDTHSHADHFSGGMKLAKELGVGYRANKTDFDAGFKFDALDIHKKMMLDNVEIEIIETPGHTDGSVSFLINKKAFICGDLLLLESVGRPDLARSENETVKGAEKLYNTVNNIVMKLDDDVSIFPAHYTRTDLRPVTLKLKVLKSYNDSLTIADKADFVKFITENIPNTPPNYESIKRYNKSGTIIPMDYAEDLEIGPNRCAAR